MGFYWAVVYPVVRGNTVKPLGAVILAGTGTFSALLVGALIPALLARYCTSQGRKRKT